MSTDGQGTKRRSNIAENFNRLSRAHKRYRQTTDGRATAYGERERDAKNHICLKNIGYSSIRRLGGRAASVVRGKTPGQRVRLWPCTLTGARLQTNVRD